MHTGPAIDDGGLFVGLISGTSVDGIDAALVRFARAGETAALAPELAACALEAVPASTRLAMPCRIAAMRNML